MNALNLPCAEQPAELSCPKLKEICDFEWSSTVLAPGTWKDCPENLSVSATRTFTDSDHGLDLRGKGLGEPKSTAVLAGLLPRVSTQLQFLDLRLHCMFNDGCQVVISFALNQVER